MLPEKLLRYSIQDHRLLPHYLGERDYPWLSQLLELYESHIGATRRELITTLGERTPQDGAAGRYKMAVHSLLKMISAKGKLAGLARQVRNVLFIEAAKESSSALTRQSIIAHAGTELNMTSQAIEEALFADLLGEQPVTRAEPAITAIGLASQANLRLIQGFLARATTVDIVIKGNARAIVRHGKFRGLICSAEIASKDWGELAGQTVLKISGPLALFRRTTMYGRALAELIPLLMWCDRFLLKAECLVRDQVLVLHLKNGECLTPASEPRRYDSKIERQFAHEFLRKAPDWNLIREPEPFRAGATLIFPDFLLEHRQLQEKRWHVEIIGFWTPDYLEKKLRTLMEAEIENLILCVDESLNCADDAFPPKARVFFFKRFVDVGAILELISG